MESKKDQNEVKKNLYKKLKEFERLIDVISNSLYFLK